MSATSRLSNLFSQDNTPRDSVQIQRNGSAESELEIDSARQIKRQRTMEKLAEEETDDELKRPPYLHVWLPYPLFILLVLLTRYSPCSLVESVEPAATFSCTL